MINRNPTIFLDIDGVLNFFPRIYPPFDSWEGMVQPEDQVLEHTSTFYMSKTKILMFNDFLEKHPDIQVVMSSTWRTSYKGIDELKEDFKNMGLLADRIVSRTPERLFEKRGQEINKWLLDNGMRPFCILDDTDEMLMWTHKLVRTDEAVGITPEILLRVEKMLYS